MKPYYQDVHVTLYTKDCRSMSELPDESVQCVVTSPPYWGLRKYSGEQDLVWGDNHCQHEWGKELLVDKQGNWDSWKANDGKGEDRFARRKANGGSSQGSFCSLCGAWEGAYGLEPNPEMYVQHTVEILREIRRVLRKDGVVFWNIGDSYASTPGLNTEGSNLVGTTTSQNASKGFPKRSFNGLKPKNLCLIPFRVAIAAQEDGWWVRSVIIWSKPNPMPESVTDRPTESHEYILMLTKSSRYYWDQDAVREPQSQSTWERYGKNPQVTPENEMQKNSQRGSYKGFKDYTPSGILPNGRNLRTVWEFPTQPYPEAHFAVFPEKLPEQCIKAATPEVGCCPDCGASWERIKEPDIGGTKGHSWHPHKDDLGEGNVKHQTGKEYETYQRGETLDWQPTCKCNADKVPSLVLDPFAGAGTTLWVAKKLNRQAVGYELSEEYCGLTVDRLRQQVLL